MPLYSVPTYQYTAVNLQPKPCLDIWYLQTLPRPLNYQFQIPLLGTNTHQTSRPLARISLQVKPVPNAEPISTAKSKIPAKGTLKHSPLSSNSRRLSILIQRFLLLFLFTFLLIF